jgi:hypothetical protein
MIYKMKNILIREDKMPLIKKINEANSEVTLYNFVSQIKTFIKDLLENPFNNNLNDFWRYNGFNKSHLINLLLNRGIIEKENKLSDNATIIRKYKLGEGNNERKVKKLYISLFEKNVPVKKTEKEIIESGAAGAVGGGMTMGGATGCDNAGTSGVNTISVPIFGVQRREIYNAGITDEATATSNAGNYQYQAPPFSDKETINHKNIMIASIKDGYKN